MPGLALSSVPSSRLRNSSREASPGAGEKGGSLRRPASQVSFAGSADVSAIEGPSRPVLTPRRPHSPPAVPDATPPADLYSAPPSRGTTPYISGASGATSRASSTGGTSGGHGLLESVNEELRPLVAWLDHRFNALHARLDSLDSRTARRLTLEEGLACFPLLGASSRRFPRSLSQLPVVHADDCGGCETPRTITTAEALDVGIGKIPIPSVAGILARSRSQSPGTKREYKRTMSNCSSSLECTSESMGLRHFTPSGSVNHYRSEPDDERHPAATALLMAPTATGSGRTITSAKKHRMSKASTVSSTTLKLSPRLERSALQMERDNNSNRGSLMRKPTKERVGIMPGLSSEATDSMTASQRLLHFLSQRKRSYVAQAIWSAIEEEDTTCAKLRSKAWTFLLLLSVLLPLLQSIEELQVPTTLCAAIDVAFEVLFLIDVTVRFVARPSKRSFFTDPFNVTDFLSGLPLVLRVYYGVTIAHPCDDLVCKVLLGVVPLLRLLRIMRRMEEVHLLYKAYVMAFEALPVLLINYCLILLASTSLIFLAESPDNIKTLREAAWLALVSVTTTGYGDVMPMNNYGRTVHIVTVVASALYMSIPLGIIGNAFSDVWQNRGHLLLKRKARESLMLQGLTAKEIPVLFKMFDLDRNGTLDEDEFEWMFQVMKLGLSEDRRQQLFSMFDDDHSGAISDKEFVRHLFPESFKHLYGASATNQEASVFAERRTRRNSADTSPSGMQRRAEGSLPYNTSVSK